MMPHPFAFRRAYIEAAMKNPTTVVLEPKRLSICDEVLPRRDRATGRR